MDRAVNISQIDHIARISYISGYYQSVDTRTNFGAYEIKKAIRDIQGG